MDSAFIFYKTVTEEKEKEEEKEEGNTIKKKSEEKENTCMCPVLITLTCFAWWL